MQQAFAVLREHRPQLALTYGLTTIEIVFDLLYPFAIGLAINGLLTDNLMLLLPLPAIWLSHTLSAYLRQRFDTRLFTKIFAIIATRTTLEQRAAGETTSGIAARTGMAEEVVEFMERDVPEAMMALVGLFGGALMLATYDWLSGALLAMLLLPATYLYWRFGHMAYRLEHRFNNRSEIEVDRIERGSAGSIRRHFRNLARWRVRISDAEANTWSRLELLTMAVFITLLVRLTSLPDLIAGDIFAAVAYALAYVDAQDTLPQRVGALSRMADNFRRLQ